MMSPEVRELLDSHGLTFRVHEHGKLVTYDALKAALPFDPDAMVKALAFKLPSGRFAIVALRGADRADYKKISDFLNVRRADLRPASPEEVVEGLGMEVGGVAPLPIRGARVLMDAEACAQATSYCGTGRSSSTLEIGTADLLTASRAEIGAFAKMS